jgi:hypothetical protein
MPLQPQTQAQSTEQDRAKLICIQCHHLCVFEKMAANTIRVGRNVPSRVFVRGLWES